MANLAAPIIITGALVGLLCFVWLNIRVVKDGAAPDALLLLTGVSLVAHIFTSWERARLPFLGTVGGFAVAILCRILISA